MGFTHVEFLPVAEHPFGGSWGYQVTSYYAPTSRFGDPDDFRHLVDALHQAGIGVLLDWVPAHFPRDEWALARFDGTPLYEHPDPRRGTHPDWGTLIFNFGRTEVRNFLVANAVYWLDEFHIDGLRVDAVASMLYLDYSRKPGEWAPNQYGGRENLDAISFLQEANATCYKRVPGITMTAEESTAWPGVSRPVYLGGLGFGFKWNLGWMHDTLNYLSLDPIYRQYHHNEMTFSMMYAYTENFVLPLSHDEVVHGKGSLLGKMPGDEWRRFAGAALAAGLPVGPPGQAAAVHGVGVRPGQRVVGHQGAGLVGAGLRRPPGRAAAVPRPERGLPRIPRCGSSTRRRTGSAGSTPTTPRATCCPSCASRLPPALPRLALRFRLPRASASASEGRAGARGHRVHRQLLRGPAPGLQGGPARGGPLARGDQHRRDRVRRQRRRQPGRHRGRARALARPAGLGLDHRPAAGRPLAHPRGVPRSRIGGACISGPAEPSVKVGIGRAS